MMKLGKAKREERKLRTYTSQYLKNTYPMFFVGDVDYYQGTMEIFRKVEYFGLSRLANIINVRVIFPYRLEGENSKYIFYYNDKKYKFYQLLRELKLKEKEEK